MIFSLARQFFIVFLAMCSCLASAHEYTAGALSIHHPWARATVTGQMVGGGFMEIRHSGKQDDALLAVQWADSDSVELHTHTMNKGVMQMRQVTKIVLPAGKVTSLAPGGLHLMFMNLAKPLVAGETRNAVLFFEKAGKVNVAFRVEPLDYKPNGAAPKHSGAH